MVEVLWVARTGDRKTGPIPIGYIGGSREESLATCKGCPLLKREHGGKHAGEGPMCNAHYGTLGLAHNGLAKGVVAHPGRDRTLERALEDRWKGARYVRFPALGDPARLPGRQLWQIRDAIREEGLGLLGYTHFWRDVGKASSKGRLLRQTFMASCGSLREADIAFKAGWIPTVVMPHTQPPGHSRTPGGRPVVLCPAQTPKGKAQEVTCNDCGLCDRQENPGLGILFRDRGPNVPAAARRM